MSQLYMLKLGKKTPWLQQPDISQPIVSFNRKIKHGQDVKNSVNVGIIGAKINMVRFSKSDGFCHVSNIL